LKAVAAGLAVSCSWNFVGRDRLVGFHCVIERPRLHGRRLQRAALETGAEFIKYRRDLALGELGGVDPDQALPVMLSFCLG
jgi:hypothetical protein